MIPPFPLVLLAGLVLPACTSIQPQPPSAGHIRAEAQVATNPDIPPPVAATVMLPRPKAAAKAESYSVSVREIPVKELLFALARDAKLNVDVHPGINGIVTINAIDQTLQQILTRIAKQVPMRWEMDGVNLLITPDTPYLHIYKIDYVNIARKMTGTVSVETAVSSTGGGGGKASTTMTSESVNQLMASIVTNIQGILAEESEFIPLAGQSESSSASSSARVTAQGSGAAEITLPSSGGGNQTAKGQNINQAGSPARVSGSGNQAVAGDARGATDRDRTNYYYREKVSVIPNYETGVLSVRATRKQHDRIGEFLDNIMASAKRQVLIEATIAEVSLSDGYQQGINWQSLRSLRPGNPQAGFSAAQNPTGLPVPDPFAAAAGSFATPPGTFAFLLNYVAPGLGLSSTLSLLETFGKVKVLSSPKISVLNNQTAMLQVVDKIVYFEVKNDSTTTTTGTTNNFTSTAKSISVGLVMSVTPQISENGSILLNVRPTITSLKGPGKTDPTPGLAVPNVVPETQQRELESMLRLSDGEVAVMGGLMEDRINNTTSEVPGLGGVPVVGNFFRNRNDSSTKTELVIFLKPTIIRDPSIAGDYRSFRSQLPSRDFFANNPGPEQKQINIPGAGAQ
ncbi:MAG: pilus (MSHA type) biogenesis protein MshL [Sulfuritalea sp.]|nr:pilus (MSHA type) biogenesis protein MshL [Sulfuritalea sp.]